MNVSSLEHVVIRAKLGDIIGFQIIQIAIQKASFQLTIIALAIEIVPTYRDILVGLEPVQWVHCRRWS